MTDRIKQNSIKKSISMVTNLSVKIRKKEVLVAVVVVVVVVAVAEIFKNLN